MLVNVKMNNQYDSSQLLPVLLNLLASLIGAVMGVVLIAAGQSG